MTLERSATSPKEPPFPLPVPEAELSAYTPERLVKSLQYADRFLTQEETSPRLQMELQALGNSGGYGGLNIQSFPTLNPVASAAQELGIDEDLAIWSVLEYGIRKRGRAP